MNLAMLLDMAASAFGERVAVQHGDDRLSYAELMAAAGRAAADLRARRVERLALLDLNSPAVPVALFAAAWAGIPFAPLSYRLRDAEIGSLLETLSPALLVTDAERARTLRLPEGVHAVTREAFLAGACGTSPVPASDWPMEPEDIAILLFTSGTTGAPKAAVLRHRHMVSYVLGSVEFGAAGEEDATLVSVPPYHVAGMAAVVSSIYAGRRLVQLASFAPDPWLELARRERVSHAFVVPTMLARIVDHLAASGDEGGLALRALAYGGGKMPLGVIERAMQLLPETDFTNAYGLTETSSTLTVLGPDEHRAAAASDDAAVRRRLSSVGRALPSVELEIRDEDGKPLGPGERGEIHVRGEQVSGEYLGRESTRTRDGWFPTRDAGWLDEEGYLFLDGRIDDVIVRGGENLSPGEIEDALLDHPAVADVAVVGVPDEEWGEAVAAAVVLRPGAAASADELRAWVRERLRSNRAPARIEFRAELPYNETGKLLRRQVRAELAGGGS